MGLFRFVLVALALLSAVAPPARASIEEFAPTGTIGDGQRFALVIGNGDYVEVAPLRNTERDATDVAAKLRGLGFRTMLGLNLDRRSMNDAIDRFLAGIDRGAEALVYYSGHGVELHGSNYLIPIDVPKLSAGQDRLLKSESVNLSDLLLDLQNRGARVSLVLLDACRDNPFTAGNTKALGGTRGLARVEPPQGSFVIYSAGVGEQALDSLSPEDPNPNGVFTRELLELLGTPGLELREMVFTLRDEVRTAALSAGGHSQIPSYYDQLFGKFYFLPEEPAAGPPPAAPPIAETVPDAAPTDAHIAATGPETVSGQPKAPESDTPPVETALIDPDAATETETPPEPPVVIDPVELARSLQTELKRVGCYSGAIDGIWGPGSNRGVSEFIRLAELSAIDGGPADHPDLYQSLLAALGEQQERVCPLVCGARYNVEGESCVLKTCAEGTQLGNDGVCRAPRREASTDSGGGNGGGGAAAPRASGGGNCFMFNGKQVCE